MKHKFKNVIPLLISFVLAFGVVTTAWVLQDASMDGLTIRAVNQGVSLQIKREGDSAYTNQYTFTDDLTLLPCVKVEASLQDKDGTDVSSNASYVKEFRMVVKPSAKIGLYATVEVDGNIPIRVDCNNIDITEPNAYVQNVNPKDTVLTFRVWVDGDEYEAPGVATVGITLHGEAV